MMTYTPTDLIDRLLRIPPFDLVPAEMRPALAEATVAQEVPAGVTLFEQGKALDGLFVIETGDVDILTRDGDVVSHRGPRDIMGERGLLRDGNAVLTAVTRAPTQLLLIRSKAFQDLIRSVPEIARWFGHMPPNEHRETGTTTGLTALQVGDLMVRHPVTAPASASITRVAQIMRDNTISSVLIADGTRLDGIVTVRDMTTKVLAEGRTGDAPVETVMTRSPRTTSPEATGLDALIEMAENAINHLPVVDRSGALIGIIGKTDLFRYQASTASRMAADIVSAEGPADMARIMRRLPELLTHLVVAGTRPHAVSRRITDLTDAVTRRLLSLAERHLGPPPVPYLWAACGSQGRREQTGVSDQDNCLILDDSYSPGHAAYFEALATFVCDGLNEVGFVYCPGDMMATNPRWRQPRRVWKGYFEKWITEPDTEAQMLASVMFDLRAIAGETELLADLQSETLAMARKNSIFVSHMISNSLKHTPPLSLFRGFALIRSGEHKNTVDLKHAGVVPITDLGRVYALAGGIGAVNTRERLQAALDDGLISESGGRDLIDAYDLICETRLRHQVSQISEGDTPDNFMAPGALSELERNHLRDAFLVVKTMQSAVSQGRVGRG